MTTHKQTSQVEINQKPVSWRFSRQTFGETKVFYDDFHQEIILITSQFICKSHRVTAKLSKFNISIPQHQNILSAKFSPNNLYIGLQQTPNEIKIIDVKHNHIVAVQQCRRVRQKNSIHGFHWIVSSIGNLLMVTQAGLEIYQLYPEKKHMQIVKSLKVDIEYHWYLPSKQFLLSVSAKHVFWGLKLLPTKTENMKKFELFGLDHIANKRKQTENLNSKNSHHNSIANSNFYNQITLIEFGEEVGCIFVDYEKAKMYMLEVKQGQMELTNNYNLFSSGEYAIFLIDNVIIAYNQKSEMPILVDFKAKNYICAPLPISICYNTGSNTNNVSDSNGTNNIKSSTRTQIFSTSQEIIQQLETERLRDEMNENHFLEKNSHNINDHKHHNSHASTTTTTTHPHQKDNDSNTSQNHMRIQKKYQFIYPFFILETWIENHQEMNENDKKDKIFDGGNLYTLSLNLEAIAASWTSGNENTMLEFLLQRKASDSKHIILKMLRSMIKNYCLGYRYDVRGRLSCISEYFSKINQVLLHGVQESAMSFQARRIEEEKKKALGTVSSPDSKTNPSQSMKRNSVERKDSDNAMPLSYDIQARRLKANVENNLEKCSTGETVIKTPDMLEELFLPIFNMLSTMKQRLLEGKQVLLEEIEQDHVIALNSDTGNNRYQWLSATLPPRKQYDKITERFMAVCVEYTRTMHRYRLKVPTSISMLIIQLLRDHGQFYTLHQLFQYHAFPDDEKLALTLLEISRDPVFAENKEKNKPSEQKVEENNIRESLTLPPVNSKFLNIKAYHPCKQLGIDMLLRLNQWSKICQILLQDKEYETGLQLYLERFPYDQKNNHANILLSDFLESSYVDDPLRFFHMYEALDMIVHNYDSVFNYYGNYYHHPAHLNVKIEELDKKIRERTDSITSNTSTSVLGSWHGTPTATSAAPITNLALLFEEHLLAYRDKYLNLCKKFNIQKS